jgi:hypothetical protein
VCQNKALYWLGYTAKGIAASRMVYPRRFACFAMREMINPCFFFCGILHLYFIFTKPRWQCVKTNSTLVVHIKIAGLKWMFIPL